MNETPIERLLTSGLKVFAERGFREATVRDICALAGTNISSIRYYFSSKEMLYREVLAYSFREADRKYPQLAFSDESLPPNDRLKIFIRNLLMRLLDESDLGFHARLMAREIAEPTEALHVIIDTVMKPRFMILRELIPQLVGETLDQTDIDRVIHCIIGQCLVFRHSKPMIERLCPEVISSPEAIDRTADMIIRFSLGGLRALDSSKGGLP